MIVIVVMILVFLLRWRFFAERQENLMKDRDRKMMRGDVSLNFREKKDRA